jgi:hypothetical protein
MLEWTKLGCVFNPEKHSDLLWMKEFAQLPFPYIINKNKVRVFFATRPKKDTKLMYVSRSGHVDLQRNDLRKVISVGRKPLIELGKPGSFDEFGSMTSSFINYDGKTFAYYTGWSRLHTVPYTMAIGLAVSDNNCLTFNKISEGPILGQTKNEPYLLSGPKVLHVDGVWHMWYLVGTKWLQHKETYEPVYKIAHAESEDGINWVRNGNPIITSRHKDECQVSFSVFKYQNRWNAIFAYRQPLDFRKTKSNSYRLGYAWSNDLDIWQRDDDHLGIDLPENGWDSEMMAYPQVSEIDNEIYLFYCGNDFGKKGFGIARLNKI